MNSEEIAKLRSVVMAYKKNSILAEKSTTIPRKEVPKPFFKHVHRHLISHGFKHITTGSVGPRHNVSLYTKGHHHVDVYHTKHEESKVAKILHAHEAKRLPVHEYKNLK